MRQIQTLLAVGFLFLPFTAGAYETPTHKAITEAAGTASMVDQVLRESLGLSDGLTSSIGGQRLVEWLAEGSRREDSALRFLSHFHDPLADWSAAGLLGGVGQSSILWGQNTSLSGWSWQDVRNAYFAALTSQPRSDREGNLTRAFEGLGRQVHLVQDAASPAHTRNDPHALYNYESLVDQVRRSDGEAFSAWLAGSPDTPGVPDPGWRVLDGNPLAPVATARLVDADRYVGSNPATTTAALIGLAEYTNANFLSEDRIFTENEVDPLKRFPHPSRASVTEQDFDVQVGSATVKRRYFVKSAGGATGYRLATVGFLREYQQRFNLDWTRFRESPALDEGVYRDYAERLVPRAVAYSTALLDYFFRGRAGAFGDDLSVSLQNFSDDEAMDGTFALYYDDASEIRRPVPGATWVRALAPGEALDGLQVAAPTNPPARDPGIYMLVFRGMLGSEAEAVVGTQVMIESVILPRLIKRKDGTPIPGRMVQAIDVQSGEVLSSGFTDEEGRTRLSWKPGRTALFIPAVNLFPMYWAGGSTFSSGLEGARMVQTADRDAQGQVTILIPVISADWPERIEACTEQQVFSHAPDGFFQQSVLVGDGLLDLVSVLYDVNLITFIRGDNGQQTTLCGGLGSTFCVDPAAGFVAEDVNRVGQVVGELIRDMRSTHYRQITDTSLFPIGPPTCLNQYEEVEVVPVTVAER
ncbi:MAG: hypothetical protein WEG40_14220 [Candidatus Rokuibacteriota bacterium]